MCLWILTLLTWSQEITALKQEHPGCLAEQSKSRAAGGKNTHEMHFPPLLITPKSVGASIFISKLSLQKVTDTCSEERLSHTF